MGRGDEKDVEKTERELTRGCNLARAGFLKSDNVSFEV